MVLGLAPTTVVSAATDPSGDHVIINQVYGGSDDGSASHSFIELYNPTENTVKLTGGRYSTAQALTVQTAMRGNCWSLAAVSQQMIIT